MAKKSGGKRALVIVESPAKARTISKFLGKDYTVEASIGHVRDLPQGAKELPEKFKGEEWAYLGINVDDNFTPIYIVPAGKKKQVAKLKSLLKEADELYLATDEDREGEAISWHLQQLLNPNVPVHRMVFHEITQKAIQEALDHPRNIDEGLVKAQETRRILDRLFGYEVSPLLWRKIGPKLSAGRVQSVAVRLIVDRERERMAFVSATYWDLLGKFANKESKEFDANLVSVDGQKIPSGKDFDPNSGKPKSDNLALFDETGAAKLLERLQSAQFRVASVEVTPYTSKPYAPFTTSTMQQEANRKLGFTARRTMSAAQSLYENGYITYMRTDSTALADIAVTAARDLIKKEYGAEYLPDQPRVYVTKVHNAQEAHEAVRPAGPPFRTIEEARNQLNPDEAKLFELIWKRTIACQMENARGQNAVVSIDADGAIFQVRGRTIDFPGYLRAYVEGSDDPDADLADREKVLPTLAKDEIVACLGLQSKSHTTKPPARYSEAALTQDLEAKGIGRPSTYASIIETIQARDYVFKKDRALVPTWTAFSVTRLLEEHLPTLIDYRFTAQMEELLDSISRHEAEHLKYLHNFYFGENESGLKGQLKQKIAEVDPRELSRFTIGTPETGEHREAIVLRVGRYGPFIEQGERKASLPPDMAPDELTLAKSLEMLEHSQKGDEPLGIDPDSGKPVFVKTGRFGPYIQLGVPDDEEKPKNASLLKGMDVGSIDLETALKLLTLPRNLGEHSELKEEIIAQNGRFGPYVKCGSETRSLPADLSPLDVTFEQAVELLAQPKTRGRGRAAPKEPLKVFPKSPVTDQEVKLLDGRYGPYVSDGETNASLPKGATAEELTFEVALDLLAERAAAGGSKKKTKKKSGGKKATKKKSAKKKSAKGKD